MTVEVDRRLEAGSAAAGRPTRVGRESVRVVSPRESVLFESPPRRLDAFLAGAREQRLGRAASADLAAVEPALLSALGSRDDRRIRAAVTIVADHVYVDLGGRTLDGFLHRGTC